MKLDRNKALILLSAVAVAAVLGSVALTASAADNGASSSNDLLGFGRGWLGGWGCGRIDGGRRFGPIEVSQEFEQNVINIAKNDQDVQKLLNDGYNITAVRPIIKAKVEANGDVVTKATSAIVMLQKDTTSNACAWVDLEQGKVTEIVILTRTVIEKT